MRPVKKQEADRWLARRQTHPPTTPKEAENAWGNFRRKDKTRDICLHEQFGLCAYSEIVLEPSDFGMHLDHVEPKSKNPARTFEHGNLLLSAINDAKSRNLARHDVFGGHFRLNRYSASGFIHPLKPNSGRFFHYASDGTVMPVLGLTASDARKARYTIAVLNLNASILVNRRKHWLAELEQEIDNLQNDPIALRHFAELELCPTNNRLRPFHSAVRQRFGNLGRDVLQHNCAECL